MKCQCMWKYQRNSEQIYVFKDFVTMYGLSFLILRAMLQDWILGDHILLIGNQGVGKNKLGKNIRGKRCMQKEKREDEKD